MQGLMIERDDRVRRLPPEVIRALTVVCSVAVFASCYGDPPNRSSKLTGASDKEPPLEDANRPRGNSRRIATLDPLAEADFARKTRDVLEYELRPSYSGNYRGAAFTTNRWGMRDKDYEERRPPNTYRLALLGSAYTMARGVDEKESFQAVLENELDSSAQRVGAPQRYEVLNFGVTLYSSLQHLAVAERKVWRFQPNAILVVLESTEGRQLKNSLLRLAKDSVELPYPPVKAMMEKAGAVPGLPELDFAARLERIHKKIVAWDLKQLATACRKRGVLPLAVVLPKINKKGKDSGFIIDLSDTATAAGFTVLQLDDVFEGNAVESLQSERGGNARALAHRLIADALLRELKKKAGGPLHLSANSDASTGALSLQPLRK